MVGCNQCSQWFYTEHGLNIHKAKAHCGNVIVPDLIRMGVVKRRLTRKESAKITKDIINMGLKDVNLRFIIAIIKTIEVTGNSSPQ